MAFKLTASERKEHDNLITEMSAEEELISYAVGEFNDAVGTARAKLQDAIAAYNEKLATAREFVSEVAESAEGEFADKSEKWQESEKGLAAEAYFTAWTDAVNEMDNIDIDLPEDIDIDVSAHVTVLGNLPSDTDDF